MASKEKIIMIIIDGGKFLKEAKTTTSLEISNEQMTEETLSLETVLFFW